MQQPNTSGVSRRICDGNNSLLEHRPLYLPGRSIGVIPRKLGYESSVSRARGGGASELRR